MTITVKEMLRRSYFSHASVLAGKKGLDRQVSWTHVIEIERFGHLLNGSEVILTTGIGWAGDEKKGLAFLQQLIDHHAAALCIELVVHMEDMPRKMLQLADKHDFPVIAFHEEVRFIDIMMDLHEQILDTQEEIWIDLDAFHQKLMHALTSDGTVGDLLRLLHVETNKKIALHYDGEYRFFPTPSKRRQDQWIKRIEQQADYYSQPLYRFNEQSGILVFLEPLASISRFDELALKRCSEIINQYFWRQQQSMENQHMERNKWLLHAIQQPTAHDEVIRTIHQYSPNTAYYDAIIGVKPEKKSLVQGDKEKLAVTKFMMAIRLALSQHDLELFTVHDTQNDLFILLIINQMPDALIPRLQKALHFLANKSDEAFRENDLQWLCFGKVFSKYHAINRGYQTALATLSFQRKYGVLTEPFYKRLAIFRLIDQFKDNQELDDIIQDYIGPLLKYDLDKGTELAKTLKVYLQHLGQKNETAQTLHIVRQTLYHRLNKIEQLLGKDYMAPENRLMIEFSLNAINFTD